MIKIRIIKHTKIHRKYPKTKWEFRAISTRIIDDGKQKDFVYYNLNNNGTKSHGIEIYSGSNYIVGSSDPSHSRRYTLSNLPTKYANVLKITHIKYQEQHWSTQKQVNLN